MDRRQNPAFFERENTDERHSSTNKHFQAALVVVPLHRGLRRADDLVLEMDFIQVAGITHLACEQFHLEKAIAKSEEIGCQRIVHVGRPIVESLLGEPRDARPGDRVYLSAVGELLYIGHSRTDSFAIYELEGHAVLSFPSDTARIAERLGRDIGFAGALRGLFATACGPLLAVYSRGSAGGRDYLYDRYGLDGSPIALGTPSREHVLGVEGSLYYSVRRAPGGDVTLRIWRLSRAGGMTIE